MLITNVDGKHSKLNMMALKGESTCKKKRKLFFLIALLS